MSHQAKASLVNINARINGKTNPIILYLDAGTYNVTPIGINDGGLYNAWDYYGSHHTWINRYMVSSNEFDPFLVGTHVNYRTDLEALAHAESTSFTLVSDEYVNFYVADTNYADNIGGISLNVTPVPLPGAIWLLGSGFVGLIGLKYKKNKSA